MKRFLAGMLAGYSIGGVTAVATTLIDDHRNLTRRDVENLMLVFVAWPSFFRALMLGNA